MATSLAHTEVVRPAIEISNMPRLAGMEIADSTSVYISPAEQKEALHRLVRLKQPLFCGGTGNYAALTFDDGPSATSPELIALLKKHAIPATFFDIGRNIPEFPADAKTQAAYGPIGNHTWNHAALSTLSRKDIKTELGDTQDMILRTTGQHNKMMRPPYGARSANSIQTVRKLGYAEILWSADSQDGLGKPASVIAQNAINGLGPGSVILFHDGTNPETLKALRKKIIPKIERSGLTMVTVPELLVLNTPSQRQLDLGPEGCSHAGRVNVSGNFVANPESR